MNPTEGARNLMTDNPIIRIIRQARHSATCRFILGIGAALIIWTFSSKGIADALIYGAFLFSLFKASRGAWVWKQPAGLAFVAVFVYTVLSLPFSFSPYLSAREFAKFLPVVAGAFAIPVIFNTMDGIKSALLCSAVAIAATLGYDLARLYLRLGPALLERAHSFQPFILNHSNVASMMAGSAFFVFFYFLWVWRRERPLAASACLVGIFICLAYLFVLASRGPQAAFGIAFCCLGFLIPGRGAKLTWFVCVAAAGIFIIANVSTINPRFMEKSTIENFSDRDKVWSHTWRLIKDHPWLGHGYGKRNFVKVYYSSNPPKARFEFPHTHQFWLKILFESGWPGFALHLAAWLILAWQLMRRIFSESSFEDRLLPGTVGLILLFIHIYGLGDYPDNVVQTARFWLIPAALAMISSGAEKKRGRLSSQSNREAADVGGLRRSFCDSSASRRL